MHKFSDRIDSLFREQIDLSKRRMFNPEFPIREFADFETDMSENFLRKIRARGVPAVFKNLFALGRKKEVKRFCKHLNLRGRDLADLVINAELCGYSHYRLHREYASEEHKPTPEEEEALRSNGIGKFKSKAAERFVRKIDQRYNKRKNVNVHLFANGKEWHLFYFTFQEAFGEQLRKPSHWVRGDHIHYISHLWGHDLEEIMRRIQKPQYSLGGAHIRYTDENC